MTNSALATAAFDARAYEEDTKMSPKHNSSILLWIGVAAAVLALLVWVLSTLDLSALHETYRSLPPPIRLSWIWLTGAVLLMTTRGLSPFIDLLLPQQIMTVIYGLFAILMVWLLLRSKNN